MSPRQRLGFEPAAPAAARRVLAARGGRSVPPWRANEFRRYGCGGLQAHQPRHTVTRAHIFLELAPSVRDAHWVVSTGPHRVAVARARALDEQDAPSGAHEKTSLTLSAMLDLCAGSVQSSAVGMILAQPFRIVESSRFFVSSPGCEGRVGVTSSEPVVRVNKIKFAGVRTFHHPDGVDCY